MQNLRVRAQLHSTLIFALCWLCVPAMCSSVHDFKSQAVP